LPRGRRSLNLTQEPRKRETKPTSPFFPRFSDHRHALASMKSLSSYLMPSLVILLLAALTSPITAIITNPICAVLPLFERLTRRNHANFPPSPSRAAPSETTDAAVSVNPGRLLLPPVSSPHALPRTKSSPTIM